MPWAKIGVFVLRLLGLIAVPGIILGLYLAFIYAPTEAFMGDIQRIFYGHVASAWNAYTAFLIVFLSSIAYLRSRLPKWDRLALAGAEVGVLFTTMTLLSGSLWARVVWGWWWTWEPRLTTTLVMWLMYIAYLLLRQAIDDPEKRARITAVFGILAFFNVPIVHLSVQWWRSLHPFTIGPGRMELHTDMLIALIVMAHAFTVLAVILIAQRYRIAALNDAVERLRVQ